MIYESVVAIGGDDHSNNIVFIYITSNFVSISTPTSTL